MNIIGFLIVIIMAVLLQVNSCNQTICQKYIDLCTNICTCDPQFCVCCIPCLICLNNSNIWFQCCDCFPIC